MTNNKWEIHSDNVLLSYYSDFFALIVAEYRRFPHEKYTTFSPKNNLCRNFPPPKGCDPLPPTSESANVTFALGRNDLKFAGFLFETLLQQSSFLWKSFFLTSNQQNNLSHEKILNIVKSLWRTTKVNACCKSLKCLPVAWRNRRQVQSFEGLQLLILQSVNKIINLLYNYISITRSTINVRYLHWKSAKAFSFEQYLKLT
jgi:hypothetical protein